MALFIHELYSIFSWLIWSPATSGILLYSVQSISQELQSRVWLTASEQDPITQRNDLCSTNTDSLNTNEWIELALPAQDERQDERSEAQKVSNWTLPTQLLMVSTHHSNARRLKLRRRPRLPFLPRLCKPVGRTLEWPGSLMLLRLSHPPTINTPTPHFKAPHKKARRKKQSRTVKVANRLIHDHVAFSFFQRLDLFFCFLIGKALC